VSPEPQVVRFERGAPDELLGVMDDLARDRSGWVNLQAVGTDPDDAPEMPPGRSGMFAWLSSRRITVPVSTWVPGPPTRHGHEADSLGIQHDAGRFAANRLVDAGLTIPSSWRRLADHPRRGLVFELPDGTAPREVLAFLLRASDVLAPGPLPPTWVAVVHRRGAA
jgi:hypothetical protein